MDADPIKFQEHTRTKHAVAALVAEESLQLAACPHRPPDSEIFFSVVHPLRRATCLDDRVSFVAIDYAYRFLSSQDAHDNWPTDAKYLTMVVASIAYEGMRQGLFSYQTIAQLGSLVGVDINSRLEVKSVRKVRFQVLKVFNYRRSLVTPLAFLHHFFSFFPPLELDPETIWVVKQEAEAAIIQDYPLTVLSGSYKPSEEAFTASILVVNELFPDYAEEFRDSLKTLL